MVGPTAVLLGFCMLVAARYGFGEMRELTFAREQLDEDLHGLFRFCG